VIVLVYPGRQCTSFPQLGGRAYFYGHLFGVVYLARCDFTMDPTRKQRGCIKFCVNLRKSATETLTVIRQPGKKAWTVYGKFKLTETEKGEPGGEEQIQEHAPNFDIKGIVHKEFALAGQTVSSAYYCDYLRWLWKRAKTSPRTLATEKLIFTFGCCILLRIYPTGSLWCRQSQQSFNTSTPPFIFLLIHYMFRLLQAIFKWDI
jgi:hypothetical protein